MPSRATPTATRAWRLNLLEFAAASAPAVDGRAPGRRAVPALEASQRRALLYDKAGEEHYNLISALHKSMRDSDPDAAVYWLARMLEAGEDPLYIARRLVRFASEDVGNADPQALAGGRGRQGRRALHRACPRATPRSTQAVVYLATAPKSNAVYAAYLAPPRDAHRDRAEPVPLHLRNAPTTLMKELDYGKDYQYAHDEPDGRDGHGVPAAEPGRAGGTTSHRTRIREGNQAAAGRLGGDQTVAQTGDGRPDLRR